MTTTGTTVTTALLTGALLVGGWAAAVPPASAAPTPPRGPVVERASHPARVLHIGMRGPAVVALQHRLHVRADGIFGPRTLRAVLAFQRHARLVPDGVVGPRTAAALRRVGHVPFGVRVVRVAAQQKGKPYRWAGAGPRAFDCSGLVTYVFARLGVHLPHNAAAQWLSVRHVRPRSMRPGDIVFLRDRRGQIYHDGIYAGHGTWWVARHSGTVVARVTLPRRSLLVGRAR